MTQPLIWKRSTRCGNGGCVEAAWVKSSVSGSNGNCLEAHHVSGEIHVRDSKYAARGEESPELVFTLDDWAKFITEVSNGSDLADGFGLVWVQGSYRSVLIHGDKALSFTAAEWIGFVEGVRGGEFDVEVLAAAGVR